MELKFSYWMWYHPYDAVLIVPLWNWNDGAHKGDKTDNRVLIVPLWNWNEEAAHLFPRDPSVLIVPLWNWNAVESQQNRLCSIVLIVPLWNWNGISKSSQWIIGSSNRTFMELKLRETCRFRHQTWCSNRTFMELKCSGVTLVDTLGLVLIVPLWNWNK